MGDEKGKKKLRPKQKSRNQKLRRKENGTNNNNNDNNNNNNNNDKSHEDTNNSVYSVIGRSELKRLIVQTRQRALWKPLKVAVFDSCRLFYRSISYFPLSNDKQKPSEESEEYELEQLINFVRVPFYLEKFMLLNLLASFDSFLYYFTVLPIKTVVEICLGRPPTQDMGSSAATNWVVERRSERQTIFLLLAASATLGRIDTSRVYHRIKMQNTMKLYMLFNVLEMADKLLSSMGQSLLTVWLSRRARNYHRYKQLILSSLSLMYLICHGYVLLFQTITLNVAVNSYSGALLTLLLSVEFSEIKSSVFKKFDKEGLFQISIADVVERFKLLLLLLIIALRNLSVVPSDSSISILSILSTAFIRMFFSVIVVDWLKHAYITKYNRIRPSIYNKFFYITSQDHSTGLDVFQDRLGLPLLALVVLFIVMLKPFFFIHLRGEDTNITDITMFIERLPMLLLTFGIALLVRLLVHTALIRWELRIQRAWIKRHRSRSRSQSQSQDDYVPGLVSEGRSKLDRTTRSVIYTGDEKVPASYDEKRLVKDRKNPSSLEGVARYKMVSKRIW